ncbi:hypothetical protein [Leucobacter luti]|uniref:Uncharacterized protein n=1 Tax=Leucobacter luti TaxID=340320 RepID=A0A4Q7U025_9MICO|nr:hypothetical protein [Leucobacter luti]RZT66736.1 hypothetical protein EV139_0863 [Leucobacter luti]
MVKVVVANRLVRDGKTYKGGDVVDVTRGEKRVLLGQGKVRAHIEQDKPAALAAKEGK